MNKIQKRQLQIYKIKKTIEKLFVIDPNVVVVERQKIKGKVRRATILQQIAKESGMKCSPICYGMIGRILKDLGVITVAYRGYYAYVNITANKEASIMPDTSTLLPGK